jgi:hypothetical protein
VAAGDAVVVATRRYQLLSGTLGLVPRSWLRRAAARTTAPG